MGTVNLGNQTVSVKYRNPVTSQIVNAQTNFVVEPGIYRGGYPSGSGGDLVISPFVVVIQDDLGSDACARIRTTENITISWSSFGYAPGNFIVFRWPYEANVNGCYLEVHNVAASSIKSTDIVVAKYNSYTSYDFSNRTSAGIINSFLRVLPTFPTPSRNVVIKPGVIWTGSSSKYYTETTLNISSTAEDTYIYIDPSSQWNIFTTTTSSILPGKIPLARIKATSSNISNQHIIDLRSQISLLASVDNNTIKYNTQQQLHIPDDSIKQQKVLFDHNSYLRINNSQNTPVDVIGLSSNNIRTGGDLFIGKTDSANGGGRIRNVSDPINDLDAVNLKTLKAASDFYSLRIIPNNDSPYSTDWFRGEPIELEINNLLNTVFSGAPENKIAFVTTYIRNWVGVGNGVATPTSLNTYPFKKTSSGKWVLAGSAGWGNTYKRNSYVNPVTYTQV